MVLSRVCLGCLLFLGTGLTAIDQIIQIERLTEQSIEQRKIEFAKAQEKNKVTRTITKASSYLLAAAASLGIGYLLCKGDEPSQLSSMLGSEADLRKRLTELENLVKGPCFGSSGWFKSMAYNFMLSPTCIMTLVEQVARLGHVISHKIFYVPTLCWYVNGSTRLGTIANKMMENGITQKVLLPGALAKELDHNAKTLDDMSNAELKLGDMAYHQNRIISNINSVVQDMACLIAFMYYQTGIQSLSSPYKLEISDRARYLFNYTNSMIKSMESALRLLSQDQASRQLTLPIIKGFFAELEQVLISFTRIEQEN